MDVSVRHSNEERHNGLQVYWRYKPGCDGRHLIRVRTSALGGDTDAAERVAKKLKARILKADDPSDKTSFVAALDELIAEELSVVGGGMQDTI